jgi:ankyrin repeat protein
MPGLATSGETPASPPVPAVIKAEDKKPAENITAAKASKSKAVKKRHHRLAASAGSNRHSLGTQDYFRSERLPSTIYKKSYDKLNKQLPVARYENEIDGLVFVTAQHDDINGLRAVLDSGRSMELMDKDGDTPLLVAVRHNAINTTRLLLLRHANYNVADRNGMTPIQIAEQQGNFVIVHALEAAGASASQ